MPFSQAEVRLLKECVSLCIPLLVCEYNKERWMCCPRCHNVIEADYAANCSCCGQRLSWYATVKYARPLGEAWKPPKHRQQKAAEEQANAISAEIAALQEQLADKRKALKRLKEDEERRKQERLMAAIAASGRSIEDMLMLLEV